MHHLTTVPTDEASDHLCGQCENPKNAVVYMVDDSPMCHSCYQHAYPDHAKCSMKGCNVYDNRLTYGLCDSHLETNLGHTPEQYEGSI